MTESVILTAAAGISGLMFGVGILSIIGLLLKDSDAFFKDPQISFSVAIASLVVIIIIGVLAGYMPARKAMKIKAIEAIRQEN
jgi:putative ABC transport system permease protein